MDLDVTKEIQRLYGEVDRHVQTLAGLAKRVDEIHQVLRSHQVATADSTDLVRQALMAVVEAAETAKQGVAPVGQLQEVIDDAVAQLRISSATLTSSTDHLVAAMSGLDAKMEETCVLFDGRVEEAVSRMDRMATESEAAIGDAVARAASEATRVFADLSTGLIGVVDQVDDAATAASRNLGVLAPEATRMVEEFRGASDSLREVLRDSEDFQRLSATLQENVRSLLENERLMARLQRLVEEDSVPVRTRLEISLFGFVCTLFVCMTVVDLNLTEAAAIGLPAGLASLAGQPVLTRMYEVFVSPRRSRGRQAN